jgi:hypothetical protein
VEAGDFVGLNFVCVCHQCRERRWMLRGKESQPMHEFFRRHGVCASEHGFANVQVFCEDYADKDFQEYRDPWSEFVTELEESQPRSDAPPPRDPRKPSMF